MKKKFKTYREFKEVPEDKKVLIHLKNNTYDKVFIIKNDTDAKVLYSIETTYYYDKIKTITIYD